MNNDPLELAILGIEEEIECFVSDESEDYNRGYIDALKDTLTNLCNLQESLSK